MEKSSRDKCGQTAPTASGRDSHGVAGLRVADASVMPTIGNGNTSAPCMRIGEKAADPIRGASVVPPSPGKER